MGSCHKVIALFGKLLGKFRAVYIFFYFEYFISQVTKPFRSTTFLYIVILKYYVTYPSFSNFFISPLY
ncbi:hypothetical protein GGQ12_002897 [Salinibacter ruber]|nr:hypothetical protein [Salinibacter ruber]